MDKNKVFIVFNILLIVSVFIFIKYIGNKINDKFLAFAEIEATKIAKYIVNYATSDEMLEDFSEKKYFVTNKNADDEIKSIEFNAIEVNKILNKVTSNILELFIELERGESRIIDLSRNILINSKIKGYKKGIIFEIPTGLSSNNFILSNLGPAIPIKLSITGEIESYISTTVVEYGINNALITVYININVSEQIMMPFMTKKITISQQIPISMNIMNGKIPNYYNNSMGNNSPLYNLPVQ